MHALTEGGGCAAQGPGFVFPSREGTTTGSVVPSDFPRDTVASEGASPSAVARGRLWGSVRRTRVLRSNLRIARFR